MSDDDDVSTNLAQASPDDVSELDTVDSHNNFVERRQSHPTALHAQALPQHVSSVNVLCARVTENKLLIFKSRKCLVSSFFLCVCVCVLLMSRAEKNQC